MELLSTLLLVFPLLGFLTIGLLQKKMCGLFAGWMASGMIFINFVLTLILFQYVQSGDKQIEAQLFPWISFADIHIPFALVIDRLSVIMLLVINGVGLLIHLYSIGYMKGDEGASRFFAYLNLFIFFMVTLVTASTYLMLFIGWEGVGLSSYLLIGFWFKDHANNDAAKKAFIINRIGDLGFLIGMFLLMANFHTLTISEVATKASLLPAGNGLLFAVTLCFFIGATGKSAQLPLFTWLPDAMAGPTPVSALIHAATMVTAGIYLIARSNVLFLLSPLTLNIILIVGMLTAIVGSIIAIFQYDIKKVLAYSTVSQLGFMFMALGLGSFTGAMFHLVTHAFFKALLFLAAGSVIHALGGEQDIRRMGGLMRKIPYTFVLFLIGTIAISGIPPFAGFCSKEMILTAAFEYSTTMGLITTAISLLTAVYMFRLLFLVFNKPESQAVTENHHIHESPWVMTLPMSVLALLSVVGGWMQLPKLFSDISVYHDFLQPVFAFARTLVPVHEAELSVQTEWMLFGAPLVIILIIIAVCYKLYTSNREVKETTGLARVAEDKFYFDELYNALIVTPLTACANWFRTAIDQTVINGVVNAIGNGTLGAGKRLRKLQTGNVGFYMLIMVISIIILLFFNLLD